MHSVHRRQGLSQKGLVEKLRRHQQLVSRHEIGERRLDVAEFADVSRTLGPNPVSTIGRGVRHLIVARNPSLRNRRLHPNGAAQR